MMLSGVNAAEKMQAASNQNVQGRKNDTTYTTLLVTTLSGTTNMAIAGCICSYSPKSLATFCPAWV